MSRRKSSRTPFLGGWTSSWLAVSLVMLTCPLAWRVCDGAGPVVPFPCQPTTILDNGGVSHLFPPQLISASSSGSCVHHFGHNTSRYQVQPEDARMDIGTRGCGGWFPQSNAADEFWQIDFLDPVYIETIILEEFLETGSQEHHFLTSLDVQIGNRTDNLDKAEVAEITSVFPIHHTLMTLKEAVPAKFLRLSNLQNNISGWIGFKISLHICPTPVSTQAYSQCRSDLGLSTAKRIPDSAFTASSFYQAGASLPKFFAPFRARAGQLGSAWCEHNHADAYLEVDLGRNVLITAIMVQGFTPDDTISPIQTSHGIRQFSLQVRKERSMTFHRLVKPGTHPTQPQVFGGAGGADLTQNFIQILAQPYLARYVRLSDFGGDYLLCLRMELYGCIAENDTGPSLPLFNVSQPPVTKTTTAMVSPTPTGRLSTGALSTGTKIGIVMAFVGAGILLALLVIAYLRRRNQGSPYQRQADAEEGIAGPAVGMKETSSTPAENIYSEAPQSQQTAEPIYATVNKNRQYGST